MISCVDRALCFGCTACASVCPKGAISMQEDEEGFKYPVLDDSKCISCTLCRQVCPALSERDFGKDSVISAYAAKHKDKDVLFKSTSGGAFTALSDYVLENGGVVYGASFDDSMVLRTVRADSKNVRDRMRGSKYVQSDLGEAYKTVKSDLSKGKKVLFTGTPCQVDGLRKFLRGKTEQLILVDIVCFGVPSPRIFAEHINLLEAKKKSKVTNYIFRSKRWTWYVQKEIAQLQNGKEVYNDAYSSYWQSVFYSRLATRPSCHNCKYCNLNRPGDITIADCWGIDKVYPDFGSDEGVSLVFVNTASGEAVMKDIFDTLAVKEISPRDVMQPPLCEPSRKNPQRDIFFSVYKEHGYQEALKACFGKHYVLKYKIKKILKKV